MGKQVFEIIYGIEEVRYCLMHYQSFSQYTR